MGRMYIWLKWSYIVVISLIAIISLMLLGITLFAHGHFHQQEEIEHEMRAINVMYIIAVVIIVLTIFGAFGVLKEKKWALIVFAAGMILSSLIMLAANILGWVGQPMIDEDTRKEYLSLFQVANTTEILHEIQTELECCGLEGYQDWNSSIPESCLCAEESTNPCVAAPRNSSLFNGEKGDLPVMIYEKGCLPYIIRSLMSQYSIVLGIILGVILLWVLSIVLCIIILCQLDRKKHTPAVAYSAEAKAGNYTTLTELPDNS